MSEREPLTVSELVERWRSMGHDDALIVRRLSRIGDVVCRAFDLPDVEAFQVTARHENDRVWVVQESWDEIDAGYSPEWPKP